jgi:tetratricopeptide (TPR) repeat protein
VNLNNLFRNLISWNLISFQDLDLVGFTKKTYEQCVRWFGPVSDEDWPCILVRGPFAGCTRNRWIRHYYLIVPSSLRELPPLFMTIAHEMYHRVTWNNSGLRRQVWVDEMLAYQTSVQMLKEYGVSFYVQEIAKSNRQVPHLPMKLIRSIRTPSLVARLFGYHYPKGFYATVACLSDALEWVVDWDKMCQIVHYQTWEEWLDSLSEVSRRMAVRLLEIADAKDTPENISADISPSFPDMDIASRLIWAFALFRQGRYDYAVTEYREIILDEPDNVEAHKCLGHVYYEQGKIVAAIKCWEESLRLNPSQADIHYNLGNTFRQMQNGRKAIHHFREALHILPHYALAHYYLGVLLYEMGNKEAACVAWKQVLVYDTGVVSRKAKEKLRTL